MYTRFALLSLALVAAVASASAATSITVTLEPQQVSVGEEADLTISVSGSNSAPAVPSVDGLEISSAGQSTQIQIFNGAMSASTSYTYVITPRREGTFTIPPIQAGDAKSQPLTLRVLKNAGSSQPNAPQSGQGGAEPADAQYGFIQLSIPKKEFYVGELMPVEIRVCVAGGIQASVGGLPTLTSEAFALNALSDKLHQTEEIVNGRQCRVLTWHSAMTAVKAGEYSPALQMPLTVVVRDRAARRRDPLGSIFDFGNPFFSQGRQKQVTLTNEPQAIKILALPRENRPPSFSGAVGSFEISATATPQSVPVGDPVTLRMTVKGAGNFDRVSSHMLPNANGWKTYPPKSTFEPADSAGYEGSKVFEQLIMPTEPSITQTPALAFAYFDPAKRQYVTVSAAPIPLTVTGTVAAAPAPATAAASSSGAPAAGPSSQAAPPANPLDALVPNKIEAGAFVATLRPVYLSPWFLSAQSLPLLLVFGGLAFLRRKHRLATDPRWARAAAAQRAIQTQLAAMDSAMQGRQAEAFFTAARRALQQRLGERWNMNPDAVTLAEVSARMNGVSETLRPLFEMADHVSYSGQALNDADFRHWKELVTTQLKLLDNLS